ERRNRGARHLTLAFSGAIFVYMPDKLDKKDESEFDQLAAGVRKKALANIRKHKKLIDNLRSDLEKHGEPEYWKRCGDLLLANANNARRVGDKILVTDYFADGAPEIEIDGEVNKSISEVAEEYFRRYTKARNGKKVIEQRLSATESALDTANEKLRLIDAAIAEHNEEYLASLAAPATKQPPPSKSKKKKAEAAFKGARRFVSSDGFEILVGKKAKDNDYLTFRIARSLDLWLHAADYPGSHVVVRNQNKKDVPNRTLVEAAELAAFYSDARDKPKAAVNYTQRKFVNKPRRAPAGLVSLASFKTILVKPRVPSFEFQVPS
ncbi:MAG: NFACT RNA binding domain-containing protein, partial [Pyrinomonadaceae bacterium]